MDSILYYVSFIFGSIVTYLIFFIVLLISYLCFKLTFWKRQGIPNNILHTYKLFSNVMSDHDWDCIKTYGKVVGTYEFLSPTLLIAEPKLINQILVENFQTFSSHRKGVLPEQPIGKCLFLLDYHIWKPTRQLLSPTFSMASIKNTRNILKDSFNLFIKCIEKQAISGLTFDVNPYFESFVLDSVLRAFFATQIDSMKETTNPMILNSRKMLNKNLSFKQMLAMVSPTLLKLLNLQFLDREATEYMIKTIQTIIDERKKNNIKSNDLLQVLLDSTIENQKSSKIRLDDKEVIDNCLLFLVVGFDTTASALINLSYNLINNPSVYQKLLKEIDDNLDENETIFEELNKLVYLEACIYESLRLVPSGVRIERKSIMDCKLGDIFVPKDTYITIPVKAVHRDPDNFANPDEFIPERFLPENKHNIKAGTFLGFADGPRNCIGMRFALIEIKYCLAKLFKKYKFVKCDETEPIEYYFGQLIEMPKKLELKVQQRNSVKEF